MRSPLSNITLPTLPVSLALSIVLHVLAVVLGVSLFDANTAPQAREDVQPAKAPAEDHVSAAQRPERESAAGVDLVAEELVADGTLYVGKSAPVYWSVANRGRQATPGPWIDRLVLSRDDQYSPDDTELSFEPSRRELAGGQRYNSLTRVVTLPQVQPGLWYLIVRADSEELVAETREDNNTLAVAVRLADAGAQPALGRDNAKPRVTVAWISHEDFQKLVARSHEVEQPAVQRKSDPVPEAPMRTQATASANEPAAAAQNPSPTESSQSAKPSQPTLAKVGENDPANPGEAALSNLPIDGATPTGPKLPDTVIPDAVNMGESSPDFSVARQTPDSPEPMVNASSPTAPTSPTAAGEPGEEERDPQPTSSPRDEKESDPSNETPPAQKIQIGGVLTGPGIEINTVKPRFDPVTMVSVLPSQPRVEVVFNREGQVIRASILRSSGYSTVDGPILSSLYRWTAKGRQLEAAKGPVRYEFDVILR